MKRTLIFILIILLLPFLYCSAGSGSGMVIMEASSQTVLESKNDCLKLPMASTTKIMTALIVLEKENLDKKVRIASDCAGIEGSSMYLKSGQIVTVRDLLYGLLLVSGNDAANALALTVSGSVEKFVELMNYKARILGLRSTHFMNPSGLPEDNHYTTALDLARLTAAALKNDVFSRIVKTKEYKVGGKLLVNHNRLLRELDGCIGVKTGYTKDSGRCLVSAADRNGVVLICVTLNQGDDWNTHKRLYEANFKRCKRIKLVERKQIYKPVCVAGGHKAGAYNDDIYGVIIDGNKNISIRTTMPEFIYLGKKAGESIGSVEVYNNDICIASGSLVLDRNTRKLEKSKSKFRKFFEYILHMFSF